MVEKLLSSYTVERSTSKALGQTQFSMCVWSNLNALHRFGKGKKTTICSEFVIVIDLEVTILKLRTACTQK